jgi:hypothetical protein
MSEELRSILLGTAGLSVAALVAVFLTVTRGRVGASRAELRAAARLAAIAVVVQSAHFAEELATGFHRRFPGQLGLAPWPASFFVSFNLFWLVVWGLSCLGLAARRRAALAALWFLGIAALVNGVAHPLLSARASAYFPGLVTSPVLGIVGLVLLRRLASFTRGPAARRGAVS